MNKQGIWYPVQTLPRKKEEPAKSNKEGRWYPIQTLGPKKSN